MSLTLDHILRWLQGDESIRFSEEETTVASSLVGPADHYTFGSRDILSFLERGYHPQHLETVTQAYLDGDDFTPAGLISRLNADPLQRALMNIVVVKREGLTLSRHKELVMGQYIPEDEEPLPGNLTPGFIRLLLSTHDDGKAIAVNARVPHREHDFTIPLAARLLGHVGFDEDSIRLAGNLISDGFGRKMALFRAGHRLLHWLGEGNEERAKNNVDIIRNGLRDPAQAESALREIHEKRTMELLTQLAEDRAVETAIKGAQATGLAPHTYLDLSLLYYRMDAGSYTTHANGGTPQVAAEGVSAFDDLFVAHGRRQHFAPHFTPFVSRVRSRVALL